MDCDLSPLPKPEPGIEFPTVIDSTIRAAYVSCPKKFYWEYLHHFRRREVSTHLHFGKCFAAGLETFRLAFYRDGLPQEVAELHGIRRILSEWGSYEGTETDGLKTLERCLFGLLAYTSQYSPKTDHIQPYMTSSGPSVEFSFALPLDLNHPQTGEPLIYGGRFDLLGVYSNNLWVVDEKTTLRLGPSWLRSWGMRGQLLGYCKAAQAHDIPVNGAIVRGMVILKDTYDFAEVILPIKQWKIDQWWEQLHYDISNMITDFNYGHFGQAFGDACVSYNGCSFEQLCDSPHPERWFSHYHKVKWNPLHQREELITTETPSPSVKENKE